jgi:isopenicillin N synthase-like dioxygenase
MQVPHPELPPDHPKNRTIDGFNKWPLGQDEFKLALEAYFEEMTRCAFKLCDMFCIALNLPAGSLHGLFEQGIGFARLNFYEKFSNGSQSNLDENKELKGPPLGIHQHTDAGFLTILLQDNEPGLEVLHGGLWVPVNPVPGALTINVGDMAQVLCNDEWRAPLHRVLAPTTARRYSVPFFFNPAPGADIAPLPCFITSDRPPRYRPIHWGEFRRRRYAGDYRDFGEEEVQISHYAVS